MRVALLHTPFSGSGGGERQTLMLALELGKLGHTVRVFSNGADRLRCFPDLISQVDIELVPPGPLWRAITAIGHRVRIQALQRAEVLSLARGVPNEFDVLNCHNYFTNWPAAILRRRFHTPAVWMCNDPPFWYHTPTARFRWQGALEGTVLRLFDQSAAKAMDRICVLDGKNLRRVREIYGVTPTLVRTGVDAGFFGNPERGDLRKELGLEGRFVLLCVNHAAPWKGQREALETTRLLVDEIPNVALVLAGGGVRFAYEGLARALGIGDRVRFLEGFDDNYLASLYKTADVFLHLANYTWGLNATEAMAAGRPVIVADEAGVSDVIQSGQNGFVVRYGDLGATAATILGLFRDRELAERIAKAGESFVTHQLTWANYANQMLDVYREAMDDAGPAPKG